MALLVNNNETNPRGLSIKQVFNFSEQSFSDLLPCPADKHTKAIVYDVRSGTCHFTSIKL